MNSWLILLGVGLLQQGAPELPPLRRVDEHQLSIFDRQTVVDHHVHPLPELPELQTGRKRERHSERQTERQVEIQAERQTGKSKVLSQQIICTLMLAFNVQSELNSGESNRGNICYSTSTWRGAVYTVNICVPSTGTVYLYTWKWKMPAYSPSLKLCPCGTTRARTSSFRVSEAMAASSQQSPG